MKNVIILTFCLVLLAILTSCGQLPVDTTPAPINNNQYNLEMVYGEKRDVGLLGAELDFKEINQTEYFSVPLTHKGMIEITSKRCLYSKTSQFSKKNNEAKFYFKDLLANVPDTEFACIFNIYMRIAGMDKGFQGQFYALKKSEFEGLEITILKRKFKSVAWYQFSNATSENLPITIYAKKPGVLLIAGCGVEKEIELNKDNLTQTFTFGELFPTKESCVFTFATDYIDGTQEIIEANLKVFSKDVLEIPDPIITLKGKKIEVVSVPPVAFISVNNRWIRNDHLTTRYRQEFNWIRLITANGRIKLLQAKGEEIVWKPSIKY